MNAANGTDTQVDDYAARVRAALADLPAGTRDELLADLPDHLAEVAGEEDGTDLTSRLGAPEAYAADLRAAAGLPPAPAPSVRERARGVSDQPWVRSTVQLLVELRPAWWVLRALLVAWLVAVIAGYGLPLGLLLSVVAVPASVVLGRRNAAGRQRWLGITVNVLVALLVLSLGLATAPLVGGAPETAVSVEPAEGPGLSEVTNIHPYSPDGKPLSDVLLYDQDGRPIVLSPDVDANGNPLVRIPRYDADGRVVPNVYPQEQTVTDYSLPDRNGNPLEQRVPPPTVRTPKLAPR